jgi:hypothetical protein
VVDDATGKRRTDGLSERDARQLALHLNRDVSDTDDDQEGDDSKDEEAEDEV